MAGTEVPEVKSQFTCQVCGVSAHPVLLSFASPAQDADEWCISNIELVSGHVQIVTCPECSKLEHTEMLSRQISRIRQGFDINYH